MQEIVVYRNPVEAAFWTLIMNGSILPIIIGAIVFAAIMYAVEKCLSYGTKQRLMNKIMLLAALVGFGVAYWCYRLMGFF